MKRGKEASKHLVLRILKNFPLTRDCDRLLWLKYMEESEDLRILFLKNDYAAFCKKITDKKYYSQQSLGRARRKIQEECQELRGELYFERQGNQINVKKYLKEF